MVGGIVDGGYPKKNNFSVSWALAGLHLMSRPTVLESHHHQDIIHLGSAHLLGLLIERSQRRGDSLEEKAKRAEDELRTMRLVRAEDARANEKVVAIFASHEQSWIAEKKNLRLQIQALANQLKSLTAKNQVTVSSLNYRITEEECTLRIKEEAFEEEARMREELEEKLHIAEKSVEELRKQVAMFAELEVEMARVIEQGEIEKREMDEMIERKEEAVLMAKKLSDEVLKMQSDSEQKDRILSALLRKSKLDADEKQMLFKEVKMTKANKKQAELEMEKWRNKWESRHKKGSRSSYSLEAGSSQEKKEELLQVKGSGVNSRSLLLEYFESEAKGDKGFSAIKRIDHQYSSDEMGDELGVTHDILNLRDWMRLETEKYVTILEQKHFTEVEAFTEQMRIKEEKLEAFRWRLLSMDIESKRLQSHIEGLEENLTRFREENLKLKVLLVDKEGEVKSLKEQFSSFVHRCQNEENEPLAKSDFDNEENMITVISERSLEESESLDVQVTQFPIKEIEEEKEVNVDPIHSLTLSKNLEKEGEVMRKVAPVKKSITRRDSSWQMDIQALGVSYKIKRLKQQLVMLEKLAGMKQIMVNDDNINSPNDSTVDDNKQHLQGFVLVIHLLNKQLKRFQSLEDKTDDLCKRMHENSREGNRRDLENGSKEQSRKLETFLEETFQLQRYMVATGQKMMDIQSNISSSFGSSEGLDESAGFNMEQFSDVIRTLFKEIQRGLEVRIARIIGDLEGTLAFDGIQRI